MQNVLYAVQESSSLIEETLEALRLLNESAEWETRCPESEVGTERELLKAVCFIRRFPMYLATYALILRDLQQHTATLDKIVTEHFELKKASG